MRFHVRKKEKRRRRINVQVYTPAVLSFVRWDLEPGVKLPDGKKEIMHSHPGFSFAPEIAKALQRRPRQQKQKPRVGSWRHVRSKDEDVSELPREDTHPQPGALPLDEFRQLLLNRPPPPRTAAAEWAGFIRRIAHKFFREGLTTRCDYPILTEEDFAATLRTALLIPEERRRIPPPPEPRLVCATDFYAWIWALWSAITETQHADKGLASPGFLDAYATCLLREFIMEYMASATPSPPPVRSTLMSLVSRLRHVTEVSNSAFDHRLQVRRRLLRDFGFRCVAQLSCELISSAFPNAVLRVLLVPRRLAGRNPRDMPCEYQVPLTADTISTSDLVAWEVLSNIETAFPRILAPSKTPDGVARGTRAGKPLAWSTLRPSSFLSESTLQLLRDTQIGTLQRSATTLTFQRPTATGGSRSPFPADLNVMPSTDDEPAFSPAEWRRLDIVLRRTVPAELPAIVSWSVVAALPMHENPLNYMQRITTTEKVPEKPTTYAKPILEFDAYTSPEILLRLWTRLLRLYCDIIEDLNKQ